MLQLSIFDDESTIYEYVRDAIRVLRRVVERRSINYPIRVENCNIRVSSHL